MKIVFISNFFNHHQQPLSDALYRQTEGSYAFIETQRISQARLALGWGSDSLPDYVKQSYTDPVSRYECQCIVDQADVVMIGSAPYEWIANRLRNKKLTFLYSERLYKQKYEYYKWPVRYIRHFRKYTRHKNLYLLCASAYTAADFAKTGTFLNRAYKWGYFPPVKHYDNIDRLLESKKPDSLLWVARFLDLKHPEAPLAIAYRLKKEGYPFTLNIIGGGPLQPQLEKTIAEQDLGDSVHLLGTMKPEEVREYMEQSRIFLFTSDRQEGWGAVLNESMNSGCAVVASHAIGSVPFLLEDRKNGFVYPDGNTDALYEKVKYLLDHKEEQESIGRCACCTMTNEWNAENAAARFLRLAEQILAGQVSPDLYPDGICSRAGILKDSWYENV